MQRHALGMIEEAFDNAYLLAVAKVEDVVAERTQPVFLGLDSCTFMVMPIWPPATRPALLVAV